MLGDVAAYAGVGRHGLCARSPDLEQALVAAPSPDLELEPRPEHGDVRPGRVHGPIGIRCDGPFDGVPHVARQYLRQAVVPQHERQPHTDEDAPVRVVVLERRRTRHRVRRRSRCRPCGVPRRPGRVELLVEHAPDRRLGEFPVTRFAPSQQAVRPPDGRREQTMRPTGHHLVVETSARMQQESLGRVPPVTGQHMGIGEQTFHVRVRTTGWR